MLPGVFLFSAGCKQQFHSQSLNHSSLNIHGASSASRVSTGCLSLTTARWQILKAACFYEKMWKFVWYNKCLWMWWRTDRRVQLLTEGDKRMRVFMAEFRVTEKQIYSVSSVGRFPSLLRGFPGPTGPWVSAGIKNQPRRRTPCSEVNQGPTSEDEPQHDKHPAVETQISRIKPITGNSKLWRAVQNDTLERLWANHSQVSGVVSSHRWAETNCSHLTASVGIDSDLNYQNKINRQFS